MVDIINWEDASTTAADNLAVAGISDAEGWLPSTVNNFTRASWAVLAKFWDEYGGVVTVAGTADAITITTTGTHTALSTGLRFIFKAGADNTTAVTLNLDAIGAKAIRKISGGTDVALVAGDLKSGRRYDVVYDSAANSAAGAWILVGHTPLRPLLQTKTDNYTVLAADDGTIINMTAASKTITMVASTLGSGFTIGVSVSTAANAVTVADSGAATNFFGPGYDSAETVTVKAPRAVRWFTSDGTNWREYASNLVDIDTLTADATPDLTADYVYTWDASAGTLKKVLLGSIETSGTWTPADGSGAALSFTLTGTQSYRRKGSEVTAYFDVTYPATADTSAAIISGLPFTCNANTFGGMVVAFHNNVAGLPVGRVNKSTTTIVIVNTIGTAIQNSELSGDRIAGYVTYHV